MTKSYADTEGPAQRATNINHCVMDRWTGWTHVDTIYRASVALHGKNTLSFARGKPSLACVIIWPMDSCVNVVEDENLPGLNLLCCLGALPD